MFALRPNAIPASAVRRALLILIFAFLFFGNAVHAQTEDDQAKIVAAFQDAQDAHEKGDIAKAVELYKKVLTMAPGLPEAEYQLGSAYLSQGNSDEAEKEFRSALEHRPDWSLPMAAVGDMLVRKGKCLQASDAAAAAEAFRSANDLLQKAVEADHTNAPAWAAIVDLRLATNVDRQTLTATLASLKPLTDGKANAPSSLWTARGILESRLELYKDAAVSLQNALNSDPHNKYAVIANAEMALKQGDTTAAESFSAKLAESYPSDDAVKLLRAKILAAKGNYAEALKTLDSQGGTDSESAALRKSISTSLSENTDDLERRLKDDPNNYAILGRLCSLFRIPSPEKALDYCRRASEAEPNNISPAIGYGAALVQAKQLDKAVFLLRKIIEIAPDNATAHANLATAYSQSKAWAQARDEYQWLIDHGSGLPIAYYLIGIAHDELGAYLDAVANYQLFIKYADPSKNQLEIDKVNLRMPVVQKLARNMKPKK